MALSETGWNSKEHKPEMLQQSCKGVLPSLPIQWCRIDNNSSKINGLFGYLVRVLRPCDARCATANAPVRAAGTGQARPLRRKATQDHWVARSVPCKFPPRLPGTLTRRKQRQAARHCVCCACLGQRGRSSQWGHAPGCEFGPDRYRHFDVGGAHRRDPAWECETPAAVPPERPAPMIGVGVLFHGRKEPKARPYSRVSWR